MLDAFASGFLVFAFFSSALFQLAIVFGAPLGEYSFGGQAAGKLPKPYRLVSAVSFLLLLAFSGHYLGQLGLLPQLLDETANRVSNWLIAGFSVLAAVMNNITPSKKERRLWGSVTSAMSLAAILVAL